MSNRTTTHHSLVDLRARQAKRLSATRAEVARVKEVLRAYSTSTASLIHYVALQAAHCGVECAGIHATALCELLAERSEVGTES